MVSSVDSDSYYLEIFGYNEIIKKIEKLFRYQEEPLN
jgi:hypothetical protein